MSANETPWDDSAVDEDVKQSDGFKSLRAAHDKAQKDLRDAREALAQVSAERRTESLVGALRTKGVNERAAKYFPADQEPTAENVERWLDSEDGELFKPAAAAESASPPAVSGPDAEQARKVAAASNSAQGAPAGGGLEDSLAKVQALNVKDPNFLGSLRETLAAARA
jgi:hypothetical protein